MKIQNIQKQKYKYNKYKQRKNKTKEIQARFIFLRWLDPDIRT